MECPILPEWSQAMGLYSVVWVLRNQGYPRGRGEKQTVTLAKALQHCAEWSGASPSTMCCVVQDLGRYLAHLLQLVKEDFWEASLPESVEEEPVASPTPTEEGLLLSEDPEPQGVQASAPCKPIQPEEALKPKVTAGTTDPLDRQWKLPMAPLGFGPPTLSSGPPALEDNEPLVCLHREDRLDITSLTSMVMVTIRNILMGGFECCYRMWLISNTSLQLNTSEASSQPGTDQELTD